MGRLLKHDLVLKEQECEGDYWFDGVVPVYTPGFAEAFGDETLLLILVALYKINELEHPDYLQVLEYNGVKFWVISDYDKAADKDWIIKQNGIGPVVTFLLPSEY